MKYGELFNFDPILSVIQLQEAASYERAINLVETFVISDRMADQLANVVFPNLQFEKPADNKGILVVGNYGTGKSHLMSLLSALAEYPDAMNALRNSDVAAAAQSITGKFKVVRCEIGSTEMSLRDIICTNLSKALLTMEVEFKFPPVDQVSNNKDAFTELMGIFNTQFPDQGLLLIVDELLDYLRSRNGQQLILDLNFLREIGEVCQSLRFRFIAGLQESLFDNPRFQFMADSVIRVKDRFQQIRIIREDIAFVVSERLLRKTPEQQAKIREHLLQFTSLYETLATRIDEFVRLFPVHPTYLSVFEHLAVAEKREVLKTLSNEMEKLLNKDIPADETGLLSYDSYWSNLNDNAALRAIPEVCEVLDKAKVLEDKIENALTKPQYRPMALRLCHALAVQRLTTDDIYAPIGPTAEELRDGLCLYMNEMPEKTSDFLKTSIEACLREIIKTMSGQYISHNKENNQYYLDLQKITDYDSKIEERAELLSPSELDRYYFDAITRLMECADTTHITGYKIWEHEVEWIEHKITRRGYLFFGAPNERSTAQPPRDFYIYFLQPNETPKFSDGKLADEVFFDLKRPDGEFVNALQFYGGARAMADQAGAGDKKTYEDKANEHLRVMTDWLRNNMLKAFDVRHQGISKTMLEVLKNHSKGSGMAIRDLVNLVGSICLDTAFKERYKDYPTFSISLTSTNLKQAVEDTIKFITGGPNTLTTRAMLDALELFDDGKINPQKSRYAKVVLNKLSAGASGAVGTVVNRNELMTSSQQLAWETTYRLEPELFAIVLLALVYNGDIVLSLPGQEIDASNLAGANSLDAICQFKHVKLPKDVPVPALVALFELLGLAPGLIKTPNTRDAAIVQMHEHNKQLMEKLVMMTSQLPNSFIWWNEALLTGAQQDEYRQQLDALKDFIEKLQPFNSPGKLRNFTFTVEGVNARKPDLVRLNELIAFKALLDSLGQVTSYLANAQQILPPDDEWLQQVSSIKNEWLAKLLTPEGRDASGFKHHITQALNQAKLDYQKHYTNLHKRVRLDKAADEKKQQLMANPHMKSLNRLANIELLQHSSLTELQTQIAKLQTCFTLSASDLEVASQCPHCQYRPDHEESINASVILAQLAEKLDVIYINWGNTLLQNLTDPVVEQSIELLDSAQQVEVRNFIKSKQLPDPINDDFLQGIQIALSGLESIVVKFGELQNKISGPEPCTVDQLRTRFDEFIQELTKGKDINKLRIRIEQPDGGQQ